MDESKRIPTSKPIYKSQDYEFLKEEGLKIIRDIAGTTWTDHNIHDPGITLLEACCYALTEVGLRAGMDMTDLLTSGEQFAEQEFFTASQVMPVAPVSSIDFQKVFLNHPLVSNAWVNKLSNTPSGQLSVLLEFADDTLNSTVFSLMVSPPGLGTDYRVDLAFPYWDEADVQPFQEDVEILNAAFSNPWQPLKGENSQFGSITIDYQPLSGPDASLELWVILQVTSPLNNTIVELPDILQETENLLITLPNENVLKAYNHRVMAANTAMRAVQRYARDYRNLCEDFTEFKAVRLQEIAFSAILEISAGVDIESLLANILFAIDQHLSPSIIVKSLNELQGEGNDSASIYEGPIIEDGFLTTEEVLSNQLQTKIYTSDILRLIFQQRNSEHTDVNKREKISTRKIIALRSLTLSNWLDNHAITKGAKDCLQLVDSTRHVPRLSPGKCQVVIIRNDVKVVYDLSRAIEKYRSLKEEYLNTLVPGFEDLPIPKGNSLPIKQYYPLQNDLPIVYGVGKYGLSANALPSRKAKAKQLKGYLFFFEQLISGQLSQLSELNALFSANPDLQTTVFHQSLYNLPLVSELFGFDNQSTDWEDFQEDENNPYREVLRSGEQREQFLDRRNRFLDHLLARLGEDMQEYAEMVFQEMMEITDASELELSNLLELQQEYYLNALARLIRDKSAFYYDLPVLNRDRFQAYGNLLWRLNTAINLQETPLGFHWQITGSNQSPVLESLQVSARRMEAERAAAVSLRLATSESNYEIAPTVGRYFLLLREAPETSALARSTQSFNSEALAEAERDLIIQSILQQWVEFTLIPLERRLYHLLGIRVMQRRTLMLPYEEYFEIFDEIDVDPLIEKRFRLRELPGVSGEILLESTGNYEGPDDETATENALLAIETISEIGRSRTNYSIEESGANQYQIALGTGEGNILAISTSVFPSQEEAREEINRLIDHLYHHYSREGFYMIEHFLLSPQNATNPGLVDPESEIDPYSFQISFIFPSGFSRDFSDSDAAQYPAQPDRFRGQEFRSYVEKTIRKTCPAHILARIKWVDSASRGTPIPEDAPCFDLFERRYRMWLEAYHRDTSETSEMEILRSELVSSLNAIYSDSFT